MSDSSIGRFIQLLSEICDIGEREPELITPIFEHAINNAQNAVTMPEQKSMFLSALACDIELDTEVSRIIWDTYEKVYLHHHQHPQQESQIESTNVIDSQTQPPQHHDRPIKVTCPLCRQMNTISKKQKPIVGLSDKCCICWENSVQVFFPVCGHVCVCSSCLDVMNT